MIRMKLKTQFNPKKVEDRAAKAKRRVLSKFGAYVYTAAKQSIKELENPSKPMNPPRSVTGELKRKIRFAVIKDEDVIIGPEIGGTQDADTIEYGGTVQGAGDIGTPEAFLSAGFGPIAIGHRRGRKTHSSKKGRKIRVTRARITTQLQAQRASRLYFEYGLPGSEKAYSGSRYVAPRPFMVPAFEKILPQLPDMWLNSVK